MSANLDNESIPDRGQLLIPGTYPSVVARFDAHALADGPALAVADSHERWSYAELAARSNRLAHWLAQRSVGAGDVVAIFADRSALAVWALLGVMKSGAAFTMLDASYPAARLLEQARIAGATVWVDARRSRTVAADLDAGAASLPHRIDLAGDALDALPTSTPALGIEGDARAYIAFTSGTTGGPKGIVGTHAPLAHFVDWQSRTFALGPSDRCSVLSGLAHDPFLRDVLTPLAIGASVHLPAPEVRQEPERLAAWLAAHAITVVHLTPSLGELLLSARPTAAPALRWAFFAGEPLRGELVQAFLARAPAARCVNFYGATETPQAVASFTVEEPIAGLVPIGRGIDGVELLVLDATDRLVAVGEAGEICVRTPYLARGYLDGRPGGFTVNPLTRHPRDRIYRTGDRGRYLPDGNVQSLGRNDDQVKVRGFRVELREVESAMLATPGVQQAAVVLDGGRQILVGYLVGDLDDETLKRSLAARLPEYMVPARIVRLESLPLTPNGKVDRRALPILSLAPPAADFSAPRTARELLVAELWAELLPASRVSRDDDFFALGGHSLVAARVLGRLALLTGVTVPMRVLFASRTVARLAAHLDAEVAAQGETGPELRRVPRTDQIRVSHLQERLWFLEQLEPGSAAYVMPTAARLRGELRADLLEQAFSLVVARHESLRTTFEDRDGIPYQVFHHELAPGWERLDFADHDDAARERRVAEHVELEAQTPFDLARGPLLRAKLLVLGPAEHVLLFTMHHIVSDGWSQALLARELETLYASLLAGEPSPLPALVVQYADHSEWQRARIGEATLREQLAYWKGRLAGAPPALDLPTDRTRPKTQRHHGARVHGRLSAATTLALEPIARASGATLYMVLLASFGALLGRLSGQEDIVVATPVVTRSHPDSEALIGFFMNTLPMRVELAGSPPFRTLLERVREGVLAAFANQDVPFEKMVVEINPTRESGRNPIAQVALNLLNLPDMRVALPGLVAEPIHGTSTGSKLDFTLYVEEKDGLAFELVYDRDLFDAARMSRFLRRFEMLLEAVATDANVRLDAVAIQLVDELPILPDPRVPLPAAAHVPIIVAFERHAAEGPERPCIEDERRRWSYGELQDRSRRLTQWLARRGVGPGDVVAIHAERNALTVLALLAVMRSGAAFMLLDADYPEGRLLGQLRAAAPAAWISTIEACAFDPAVEAMAATMRHRIDLPTQGDTLPAYDPLLLEPAPAADARAYVVFTSGTTGQPKGIEGSHRPLAHFVKWQADTFVLGRDDRFSVLSGLAHDPFLRDVLTPLSLGASIHVPPAELRLEPARLAGWLAEHAITVTHLTPSLGEVLTMAEGAALPALRWAFFGGETLRGALVTTLRGIATGAGFVNFYGATETPQAIAYFVVPPAFEGPAPVGRGIDGVQLLVLNDAGKLAGIDEEGEIVVRTPYLSLGYLGGEGGGFGHNPFTDDPSDRVYRTGDRGRYLADGSVQALGRRDDQVKIRGFRIELSEVETALLAAHPAIKQAVVVVHGTVDARRIDAYLVADLDHAELLESVRNSLRTSLPTYMVPSAFVVLTELPLTPNGKVDRNALPPPDLTGRAGDYVAPRDRIELQLAEIWRELLGAERVGIHDDFFALGGHSLLATRCTARIQQHLGQTLPVRVIFEAPTIALLAAALRDAGNAPVGPRLARIAQRERGPLSHNQVLWWRRQQEHPELPRMNYLRVYRIAGPLDAATLAASADEVFRRHDALRTSIALVEGVAMQMVASPRPGMLEQLDLAGRPEAAFAELQAAQRGWLEAPDAIGRPELKLVRLGPGEHRLLVRFHRASLDPLQGGAIVNELLEIYGALASGRPSPLAEPELQYLDYVAWQREVSRTPAARALFEGAERRIAGARPPPLPFDVPAPRAQTTKGRQVAQPLDDATWAAIADLARAGASTQFVVLGAIYKSFLAMLTGERRIVIIAPNTLARGQDAAIATMMGCFSNYFVTVTDIPAGSTLRAVVRREHAVVLDAYREMTVPCAVLIDPVDDSPICGTALNYIPEETDRIIPTPGLDVTRLDIGGPHRIVDLAWLVFNRTGLLLFSYEKFDAVTAERIGADFAAFIVDVLAAPDAPIEEIYARRR